MKRTALHRAGILFALLLLFSFNAWSDDTLKPFLLVSNEAADFKSTVDTTKNKLQAKNRDERF